MPKTTGGNAMKSLQLKVMAGFSVVTVLMTALIIINVLQIRTFNNEIDVLVEHELPLLIADERLQYNLSQQISLARGYLLFGDDAYKAAFHQLTEESTDLHQTLTALSESVALQELIEKSVAWGELIEKEIFAAHDQGRTEEAIRVLSNEGTSIGTEIMEGLSELVGSREAEIVSDGHALIADGERIIALTIGLTIFGILGALTLAYILSRRISKPIQLVTERGKMVASGDLSKPHLDIHSKDEVGQLAASFNHMTDQLKVLIRQVAEGSEQVTAASEELTASARETTQATHQVAATIQELSTGAETTRHGTTESARALEEMAAGIGKIAESAAVVSETVVSATAQAKRGSEQIQQAVEQMVTMNERTGDTSKLITRLGERSEEIGSIVEVISDISEQTNLLALNASIEAARAGEHGLGFAVVAGQVRKLAEQANAAANQISDLIKEVQEDTARAVQSTNQVVHGVKDTTRMVQQAGEGFGVIVKEVDIVAAQVQEVSALSEQMSSSSQEISASITETSKIAEASASSTQSVAAIAEEQLAAMEEVTSSSEGLSHLATELQDAVKKFRI
ncbi:hypothetical protein CHH75_00070 [Paenibacillus sp. 7541]|nr:hypothetical protein CHH75_00070 [Paenibacillus sp. 7541]